MAEPTNNQPRRVIRIDRNTVHDTVRKGGAALPKSPTGSPVQDEVNAIYDGVVGNMRTSEALQRANWIALNKKAINSTEALLTKTEATPEAKFIIDSTSLQETGTALAKLLKVTPDSFKKKPSGTALEESQKNFDEYKNSVERLRGLTPPTPEEVRTRSPSVQAYSIARVDVEVSYNSFQESWRKYHKAGAPIPQR